MDNHQSELADSLLEKGYLLVATPESVAQISSASAGSSSTRDRRWPGRPDIASFLICYSTLAETIKTMGDTELVPFPPPEEGAFRRILDWEMGYTD